jgi:glucosamine-6-phosphate deaminase
MNSTINPLYTQVVDQLKVHVYADRYQMGTASALEVVEKIKELLRQKDRIRMVFAAAPSQNEFLATLSVAEGIDWSRITVFHMDEYIGLSADAPQRFSQFLRHHLFDIVGPGVVNLIDSTRYIEEECQRYGNLLSEAPIDIICLGIGENGHLAFNDPPVADFCDPQMIKSVELDEQCRQQQVNDGCFPNLDDVPTHALTITIPTILSGAYLYCMVPSKTKKEAVHKTLNGPITTECPASILRSHPHCTLYLDTDSYEV